jgi:hypothetical protein
MASISSVRDRIYHFYAVRPVSFRGQPIGPEYKVVTVAKLASPADSAIRKVYNVDRADIVRRFTRASWLAIRPNGSVAFCGQSLREVKDQILAAHA